jgi:hypothetical protein
MKVLVLSAKTYEFTTQTGERNCGVTLWVSDSESVEPQEKIVRGQIHRGIEPPTKISIVGEPEKIELFSVVPAIYELELNLRGKFKSAEFIKTLDGE